MKAEHWIAVVQIGVSLASSVVAAYLAVRWSLRRFRSERWWELQSQTYCRLLENLAILKHCFERCVENLRHPDYADGPNTRLTERVPSARAEIEKIAAMGALYISKEASDELDRCLGIVNIRFGTGSDEETYLEAVSKCVERVRKEALMALQSR